MTDKKLHILLFEDDEDHAELIKRSLEENCAAYELSHAKDGQEGLDMLFIKGMRPDLILLDLRLPKVDGFEVLKRIKQMDTYKQIPVIILTSSEAEQDLINAYDNHANSYLVKPLNFAGFMDMTKSLGFYWLNWNKYLSNHQEK